MIGQRQFVWGCVKRGAGNRAGTPQSQREMNMSDKCKTCGAIWDGPDNEHLLTAGKIWNSACQECGFDSRVHGQVGSVFTLDEFGEPQ